MRRIKKGFGVSVTVLSAISLILGIGIAISTYVLKLKTSNIKVTEANISQTTSHESDIITFNVYWWGGFFYLIPGLFGLLAGLTRKGISMVIFSIFNVIYLIASSVVCVLFGLMFTFWVIINTLLKSEDCTNLNDACICRSNSTAIAETYSIRNSTCSNLYGVNDTMMAIIVMITLSTSIAFIASIVGYCALWNKEEHDSIAVTYQGGYGGTSYTRGKYQVL